MKKNTNRRGAALVEMACVLGILCMLTVGLVECGVFLWKAGQVSDAARVGARQAAMYTTTAVDQVTGTGSPLMTTLQNAKITPKTVTVTGVTAAKGASVAVKIEVDYDQLSAFGWAGVAQYLYSSGSAAPTKTVTVTMVKEGP